MGLLRKKTPGVTNQVYSDTEGLIVNLGVLCALLLSFAFPLLLTDTQYTDRIDFMTNIFENCDFRSFVVQVLDNLDVGTYQHEAFDWNVIAGFGLSGRRDNQTAGGTFPSDPRAWAPETINVRDILLNTECYNAMFRENVFNTGSNSTMHLEFAFEIVYAHFPMEQFRAWRAFQPKMSAAGLMFVEGGIAVSLLVVGLVGSIALYVSLAMSAASEDEEALAKWNQTGIPITIFLYICALVALVAYFISFVLAVYSVAPKILWGKFINEVCLYMICISMAFLIMICAVFSYWRSRKPTAVPDIEQGEKSAPLEPKKYSI